MSQFYLPGPWADQAIQAPVNLAHHLRVRRIRDRETIQVFDGLGKVGKANISDQSTEKVIFLEIFDIREDFSRESRYPLVLIQGIAGGDKMDWIIEKAVELGATHIVPVPTVRSIVKLDAKRAQKKLEHWESILIAACEQSERTVLPKIFPVQSFDEALTHSSIAGTLPILLSPRASMSLVSIAKRSPGQGMTLLIGPEGGLNEQEELLAEQKGFTSATLGHRILRTETAAIVAMSAVHTLWGGF